MISREILIQEIKKYIGIPFLHMGRGENGLDCIGLIYVVAKNLNLVKDYKIPPYNPTPDFNELYNQLKKCSDIQRILIKDSLPGDFFLISDQNLPCHFAFLIDKNQMVHANRFRKKVVCHRISEEWRNKFRMAFSFKDLKEASLWRN